MSLVINTNIASLEAQNNLSSSSTSLDTAVERLSSGLRLNSAADDAAGYAIADAFTAQINGANQAISNSNNGISLAQTAEGSLSAITADLQSIRTLAVESANGTNDAQDQADLNTQAQALISEIDRQANVASFNGVSLFNGSNNGITFQVGGNTTANDSITVAGFQNLTTTGTGATLGAVSTSTLASTAAYQTLITGAATAVAAGTITINGVDIGALGATTTASQRVGDFINAVNAAAGQDGNVTASLDTTTGIVTLSGPASFTVVGATAASVGIAAAASPAATVTTANYGAIDISTTSGALNAINSVDAALNTIDTFNATLGATQNRFTNVVNSLTTTAQNLTSARSTIQDTDYAAETADFTQDNILQQAGTAVLAQANSLPKNVLTLLQNL